VAHAHRMAARRPVNQPAEDDAKTVQQRQWQAGKQFEQGDHAARMARKGARQQRFIFKSVSVPGDIKTRWPITLMRFLAGF